MTMDFMEQLSGRIGKRWAAASKERSGFLRHLLLGLACAWPLGACGVDVGLAGVFPGKALLTIDGSAARIVAVGTKTKEGVRVIAVDNETATLDIAGKRRVLHVGENVAAQPLAAGPAQIVLTADTQGHFVTVGYINGSAIRFLVDTGASMIAIGASDARRLGIDPAKGKRAVSQTANGQIVVRIVKLDSVRIGDITLNNVDATLHSHDLPLALLGMSFLNRMEMQRSGSSMTLIKRF